MPLLFLMVWATLSQASVGQYLHDKYGDEEVPDIFEWSKVKRPFDQEAYFKMLQGERRPKKPFGYKTSYDFLNEKPKRPFSTRLFMNKFRLKCDIKRHILPISH